MDRPVCGAWPVPVRSQTWMVRRSRGRVVVRADGATPSVLLPIVHLAKVTMKVIDWLNVETISILAIFLMKYRYQNIQFHNFSTSISKR